MNRRVAVPPTPMPVVLGLAAIICAASCGPGYPVRVTACVELVKANSAEICLVDKQSDEVVLGPCVEIVHRIDANTIVLQNRRNDSYKAIVARKEKVSDIIQDKYRNFPDGYYLHKCGTAFDLFELGTDRDAAIELAERLAVENSADPERR